MRILSLTDSDTLLLRAALADEDAAVQAWDAWRAEHDLQQSASREFAILHHLAHRDQYLDFGTDAPLLLGLRKRAWVVNQQTLLHLHQAIDALTRYDITARPIRGSALLLDPSMSTYRPVTTVDLWIGAADWTRSLEVLPAHGWAMRHRPRASMTSAFLDDNGRSLVLTWGREFPQLRRTPPNFARGAMESTVADSLSDGCLLTLAIVEGITAPASAAITWPLDAMQLLQDGSRTSEFWQSVRAHSVDSGYGPLVAEGLNWLMSQVGADIPRSVIEQLSAAPMDAVVLHEIAAGGAWQRMQAAARRRHDIRQARQGPPWSAVPRVSPWSSGIRFLQARSSSPLR